MMTGKRPGHLKLWEGHMENVGVESGKMGKIRVVDEC
jgi:hypothetical protein